MNNANLNVPVNPIENKWLRKAIKCKNVFLSTLKNPFYVISIVSLISLFFLIIVPLWEIIKTSFQWQEQDLRSVSEAVPGKFTFYHWIHVFSSNISKSLFYVPLLNSLLIGIVVSFFALLLGGLMAWIVTRTDIPCRKLISFLVIVPYMLPSWYKALAWITVFKNSRIGGKAGFIQAIFNVDPPNWLSYGFVPIVITLSIHYYTFTYLLVSGALSSIGGDLEEMAEVVGAKRFTILRKITFPLVLPAILSAFILTFSRAIGTFGVPAFLGLKVNYYTIPTMLYSSMRNRQTVSGYILSLALIAIAIVTIYFNQKAIGKRKSYSTIAGKGTRKTLVKLGPWKIPLLILIFLFILVAVIFPIVILLLQSFLLKDGVYEWSNFTLHFWVGKSTSSIAEGLAGIFRNSEIWKTIGNTLELVLSASIISTLAGLILGYVISRGRKKLIGRVIDQVSFLPYLIPSISFGAIYLSMFSTPKLFMPALYGTLAILIIVSVVKYLPFSTRAGVSNMVQISTELEEAAMIEGASFIRRFMRIIMPISRKGFMSGFLLTFISGMKELDLIVLLVTPSINTLTYLTYYYADSGFHQFSDAVVSLIVFIIITIYLLAAKIGKADITQGIGG